MFGLHKILIILSLCALSIDSVRILAIFSMPSPSHYIYASAILKELASRGHEITSVGVYPQKKPIKNFRDIFVQENVSVLDKVSTNAAKAVKTTSWEEWNQYMEMTQHVCEKVFENKEFQELLNSPEDKFDLIIAELILSVSLSGLGEHFNAPMISISPFGTSVIVDDVVGNSSPASIIPSALLPYSSQMTLWQRFFNFWDIAQVYIENQLINLPKQKVLYDKYFPNAKLSFDEAGRDFSLLLINQHPSLSYPRPYVPNVIEAGGAHIPHKPEPLPKDLQQFLDNATEGSIYFSLGSNVKSKEMDIHKREIFLNVFRGLKQKVLWKFEDPEMPGKPDNVFISPWIPQYSVLAHPNVKVFMTHGGLLSKTEAIFYGKPILGIPMFAEQPRNVAFAVNRGIALSVEFQTLNEPELKHKLNELLFNPKYSEKMKEVSFQYHDKPMTAMETAIYWIEYVIRHKGAKHLRSAGVHLNIFQYYCLDVIGIILSGLMLTGLIIIWLAKKLFKLINGSKKVKTGKAGKKVKSR